MKIGFQRMVSDYHLLHEAVNCFFLTLHEIIPCNTFFLAVLGCDSYSVLNVWNSRDRLVEEGQTLSPAEMEKLMDGSAYRGLGYPIIVKNDRVFGRLCALDREREFKREDAEMLERLAELIGRLIEAEESVMSSGAAGENHQILAESESYAPADAATAGT
jgi:hypothetical protein